jgi:PAS domain S-box-containing protein
MKISQSRETKLVPISWKAFQEAGKLTTTTVRESKRLAADHLHHLAFNNSLLPNIISVVSNGKIIGANQSACKLLGYSKKILLTKYMKDIFISSENNYKELRKQRRKAGQATGELTIIKKGGIMLSCQVTSVIFSGDNDIKKAVTTIADRSENILKQKKIDFEKEEQVAAETLYAKSQSDATLTRLDDLEHKLDVEISEKEELYTSSLLQQTVLEQQLEEEIRLKETQIGSAIAEARELERSGIGQELHDNVNQLLAASRLYLDVARKNKTHRELYLSRSSDYTLSAIEEIRKLTKGLTSDEMSTPELIDAIENITMDIMQVSPLKISSAIDPEIQPRIPAKFNLTVYRIVQEQLNNIIKHAKASVVEINLSQNKSNILLSISDDGLGFDITKKRKGIGLSNIKRRVDIYKGKAQFVSKPGKGCVLKVSFPLSDSSI